MERSVELAVEPAVRPEAGSSQARRVLPPFVAQIRALIERDQTKKARLVLELALEILPADPELLEWKQLLATPVARPVATVEPERWSEHRWLALNAAAFRGRWVALLGSELLAAREKLGDLRADLSRQRVADRPLILRIPESADAPPRQ